jgi:hypothetical protein
MSARVESPLAAAVLEALDDTALAALADMLAPLLAERLGADDEWMDRPRAAAYLSMGASTLLRKAKVGEVPAHQDVPNGSTRSGGPSSTRGGARSDRRRASSPQPARRDRGLRAASRRGLTLPQREVTARAGF